MAGFLLLVAPGIVFQFRRERHFPQLERTAFREAASVALASVVCSGLSCLILVAFNLAFPGLLPDPRQWIASPHEYFVHHYALIATAIAIEVALAIVLALIAGEFTSGRARGARSRPQDSVWTLLHEGAPVGTGVPALEVRTKDGTSFRGPLFSYDSSGSRADRHLVLGPPLHRQRGEEPVQSVIAGRDRVILPMDILEELYVSFLPPAAKAKRSRWQRIRNALRETRASIE